MFAIVTSPNDLSAYESQQARLARRFFALTDEIASFDWDYPRLAELHHAPQRRTESSRPADCRLGRPTTADHPVGGVDRTASGGVPLSFPRFCGMLFVQGKTTGFTAKDRTLRPTHGSPMRSVLTVA